MSLLLLLLLGFAPLYFASMLDYDHLGEACIVVNSRGVGEKGGTLHVTESLDFQIFYSSIEGALNDCPLDPVVIFLVESHYRVKNVDLLKYTRNAPLQIIGIGEPKPNVRGFANLVITHDNMDILFRDWHAIGNNHKSVFKKEHTQKVCRFDTDYVQYKDTKWYADETFESCDTTHYSLPCLIGGRLQVEDMEFSDYAGNTILCQEQGVLIVKHSVFSNVNVKALAMKKPVAYIVKNNRFCKSLNNGNHYQSTRDYFLLKETPILDFNTKNQVTGNSINC